MQKAKNYDWKDSNMALFGSEVETNIKKASAETEEAWQGAGGAVGLQIWRINQFKVEHWSKEDHGSFFDGDSYIIMNTYKKPGEDDLEHDLHFWIGTDSTQDEYGTAAYKTVELDTLLNDKPVQHREVMGHESDLFKSYFKNGTKYLNGGVATGFKHVEKKVIQPKLFHFHGDKKGVTVRQVPLNRSNIDSNDVFILETDKVIYQYNGESCNKDEKFKATQYCSALKSERGGKANVEVLDAPIADEEEFWTFFSDDNPVENKVSFGDVEETLVYRLSDAGGDMSFAKVAQGDQANASILDTNDVFIIDKKGHCYVWIGKNASNAEKRQWSVYAHNYLKSEAPNPVKPVTAVTEGREPANLF
jgi:gelsolin